MARFQHGLFKLSRTLWELGIETVDSGWLTEKQTSPIHQSVLNQNSNTMVLRVSLMT